MSLKTQRVWIDDRVKPAVLAYLAGRYIDEPWGLHVSAPGGVWLEAEAEVVEVAAAWVQGYRAARANVLQQVEGALKDKQHERDD